MSAPSFDDASDEEKAATAKSLATFKMMLALLASRDNKEHPAIVSALVGVHVLMFGQKDDDKAMEFYDGFMRQAVLDSFQMIRNMGIIGERDEECDCENCTKAREAQAQAKNDNFKPVVVNVNGVNAKGDTASSRDAEFKAILARMREGSVN